MKRRRNREGNKPSRRWRVIVFNVALYLLGFFSLFWPERAGRLFPVVSRLTGFRSHLDQAQWFSLPLGHLLAGTVLPFLLFAGGGLLSIVAGLRGLKFEALRSFTERWFWDPFSRLEPRFDITEELPRTWRAIQVLVGAALIAFAILDARTSFRRLQIESRPPPPLSSLIDR